MQVAITIHVLHATKFIIISAIDKEYNILCQLLGATIAKGKTCDQRK
jgi:hypothetical protein